MLFQKQLLRSVFKNKTTHHILIMLSFKQILKIQTSFCFRKFEFRKISQTWSRKHFTEQFLFFCSPLEN